jgi:CPA1 family monovalent cation:H+ antiporter
MHDSALNIETILIAGVLGLIALNALSYYSSKQKLLPAIIWTVLIGLVYSFISHFRLLPLPELELKPEIVLFLFVPLLIFASTHTMCLHHFRRILGAFTILATVGISISMVIGGLIFMAVTGAGLAVSMLFGAIISATDPLAISAVLKGNTSIDEHRKLLIEGESILNDGFVVALFGIFSVLAFEPERFSALKVGSDFFIDIVGALAVGLILGRGSRLLLKLWHGHGYTLRMNMTLALAYSSFIVAEVLGLSGVIAVFAAALAYGYRPEGGYHRIEEDQEHVWGYMEYVANSILFFLIGASFFGVISQQKISVTLIAAAIAIAVLPRFIAVYALRPTLRIYKEKATFTDVKLLAFSGSRGALSVALILLLPEDFKYRPLFLAFAGIIILMTLVAYPPIVSRILKGMENAKE